MERRWSTVLLPLCLLAGIIVCMVVIYGGASPREALLLSLVLTIFSMSGSWVASRYYAEESFNRNLRMFALKAAEKVTNLSNELDRLSIFLQRELNDEDYESPSQELLAKELRIDGAVHIINTLKSVNDRSLSDWQGVIGDEITAQREEQEGREEELRELMGRFESLAASRPQLVPSEEAERNAALRAELSSMRADLRVLASQIGGFPLRRPRLYPAREAVEKQCPKCSATVRYKQRRKEAGIKPLRCTSCGVGLYSTFAHDDFVVRLRMPLVERVACPACAETSEALLDPVPGAHTEISCSHCSAPIRVIRTATGVSVKLAGPPGAAVAASTGLEAALDEPLLERVRTAMPAQPWPTGTGRQIAARLNVPHKLFSRAINELISRGVFKLQHEGRLYCEERAQEGAGQERPED